MITGFADTATRDIYDGKESRAARAVPKSIWPVARRKLDMLNAARELLDLTAPPGNRLEKLKGDLAGFHSIRVNEQYRIVFKFANGNASDVRLTDYH
jgi:proteic killer suppression protein